MVESEYAVIRTGGKQYRVAEGTTLLVERLSADEGADVTLEPLLYSGGGSESVIDPDQLSKVNVTATIVGHERGPKLRVVKFKPKRGYKRRTGHRQDLTRIQITEVAVGGGSSPVASKAAASASEPKGETPAAKSASKPGQEAPVAKSASKPKQEASAAGSAGKPEKEAPVAKSASKSADVKESPQKETQDGS